MFFFIHGLLVLGFRVLFLVLLVGEVGGGGYSHDGDTINAEIIVPSHENPKYISRVVSIKVRIIKL